MSDALLIQPAAFAHPPALVPSGDDVVLIHPGTGLEYRLNRTGRFLWEALQEPTTMSALRERILRAFDVDANAAAQTAESFVQKLWELGFLELQHEDGGLSAMRRRYLQLLKKALVNLLYPEHELRLRHLEAAGPVTDRLGLQRALRDIRYADAASFDELVTAKQDGRNFRKAVTRDAHTMVGLRRLENIEWCAAQIFAAGVEGDFLEAGVCQGGASIFMRALQVAYGEEQRRMWVADSFEGLPAPRNDVDAGLDFTEERQPWLAASLPSVQDNFRTYDLLSDRVRFVRGWFSDSLASSEVERIALLRIDADLYESTRDVLVALYDRVTPGGFIIVDDYHAFRACRTAVDEFRAARGIADPLRRVDWTATYWQKSA
ncbi:MAG TPA: PqqD family peptide modification chaperone [Thermoanaerobaculia bacterium]|jgi:O-methyltransferase